MIRYGVCPRCKEHKLNPENCKCEMFQFWYEDVRDLPEEMHEIYALSYAGAAEAVAKRWYEGESECSPLVVFVKRPEDDRQKQFRVDPELEISFHATELSDYEKAS